MIQSVDSASTLSPTSVKAGDKAKSSSLSNGHNTEISSSVKSAQDPQNKPKPEKERHKPIVWGNQFKVHDAPEVDMGNSEQEKPPRSPTIAKVIDGGSAKMSSRNSSPQHNDVAGRVTNKLPTFGRGMPLTPEVKKPTPYTPAPTPATNNTPITSPYTNIYDEPQEVTITGSILRKVSPVVPVSRKSEPGSPHHRGNEGPRPAAVAETFGSVCSSLLESSNCDMTNMVPVAAGAENSLQAPPMKACQFRGVVAKPFTEYDDCNGTRSMGGGGGGIGRGGIISAPSTPPVEVLKGCGRGQHIVGGVRSPGGRVNAYGVGVSVKHGAEQESEEMEDYRWHSSDDYVTDDSD